MTVTEVRSSLTALGIDEDVWLHETNLWQKIGTICTQSTYHIYLNPNYDYRFNSTTEVLEIALLNDDRTVKKAIEYENIVCFNGIHGYDGGVPVLKNFR
jgi:hypothetical protein